MVNGDNYTGVPFWTFLDPRDSYVTRQYVVTAGTDGYEVVLSLAELVPSLGGNPANLIPYADTGTDFPGNGVARTILPGDNKHGRWESNLDRVAVAGKPVRIERKVYLALNKPTGVLCTSHDTHGRKRVLDLLPASLPRLFTVGRLDYDTEGLLFLTNDGTFSLRLTHPRYKMPKTYAVEIEKALPDSARARLLAGLAAAACAGFLSRVLQLVLPTHPRPLYTETLGFVMPSESRLKRSTSIHSPATMAPSFSDWRSSSGATVPGWDLRRPASHP
jgi:hypothetical protein